MAAATSLRSNPSCYARKEQIQRAISIVRETGMQISTVELCRDGTIRLSDQGPAPAETLFDALDRAQKL